MGDQNIQIRNLTVKFPSGTGWSLAVDDISLNLESGIVTGLVGESGSGKSVLGMSILRLLGPSALVEGECWYQGRDLYRVSERELEGIRGGQIGLIPQNPTQSLNPTMRIGSQLQETRRLHGKKAGKQGQQEILRLLRELGMDQPERISGRYSFEMSGGMNQRVVSAMGLCGDPRWMIADEPTKGLDAVLRRQVFSVLREISANRIPSMLLITHDLLLAERLCGRICVLYSGVLLEQGGGQEIFQNPLHPYTKGLFQSLPSKGMRPIPAPMREKGKGCVFYNRCPMAQERCGQEKPGEYEPKRGRIVRCFLYA